MQNKTKKIVIPMVAIMALALVAAAVFISQTHVDVTVNEAINETVIISATPTAYPGEIAQVTLTIENLASVDENLVISSTETDNDDGVDYTDLGPVNLTVTPGTDDYTLDLWSIDSGSPVGTFGANLTITRV